MKKLLALCICLSFGLSLSGCVPGDIVDQFVSVGDASTEDPAPDKPRVYMDEVHGILQDFTGNQLTVLDDEESYVFDVSQATLECEGGMITGDEISVIYEGQLNNTDTSSVKALKVVDEYHKKTQLEDQKIYGYLQRLTANTITVRLKNGNVITFPTTGCEQYFQNGVQSGTVVCIHYKGQITDTASDSSVLNGKHLKVLSIADIEPLVMPSPTPTPVPSEEDLYRNLQMHAMIQNVNLNVLQVAVQGANTVLNLDMTGIPCYFKGGLAPESSVTIVYDGEFNGTTTEGISIVSITGDDPENSHERNISSTVSGEIIASTANTITIQTPDGAVVTCSTTNARNASTGGLLTGSSVKITFNPASSRQSNIYTCLKIEDV